MNDFKYRSLPLLKIGSDLIPISHDKIKQMRLSNHRHLMLQVITMHVNCSIKIHTSISVILESERRSGPTDAASTVKVNLEAKSSFLSVSTCRFHISSIRKLNNSINGINNHNTWQHRLIVFKACCTVIMLHREDLNKASITLLLHCTGHFMDQKFNTDTVGFI